MNQCKNACRRSTLAAGYDRDTPSRRRVDIRKAEEVLGQPPAMVYVDCDDMRIIAYIFCILGLSILICGVIFTFAFELRATTEWDERALRGDFWGGHIGAISSIAGSFLFFAAILFQARELHLQREQLRLQRKEMRQVMVIYKKQAAQLREQNCISRHDSIFSQVMELATFKFRLVDELRVVEQKLRQEEKLATEEKLVSVPETDSVRLDNVYHLRYERKILVHQINSCVAAHCRLLRSDYLTEEERTNLDRIVSTGALGEASPDDEQSAPQDPDPGGAGLTNRARGRDSC